MHFLSTDYVNSLKIREIHLLNDVNVGISPILLIILIEINRHDRISLQHMY